MIRSLVVVLLALAGCSSTLYWTKPSFTAQEFNRDNYECLRDTRPSFVGGGSVESAAVNIGARRQADHLYRLCMESKGWTLVTE